MKHPAVLASIIVSIALLACTIIASVALGSLGASIERVGRNGNQVNIPDVITLRTPDLGTTINLRLANGGGGGEALRLETASKH